MYHINISATICIQIIQGIYTALKALKSYKATSMSFQGLSCCHPGTLTSGPNKTANKVRQSPRMKSMQTQLFRSKNISAMARVSAFQHIFHVLMQPGSDRQSYSVLRNGHAAKS